MAGICERHEDMDRRVSHLEDSVSSERTRLGDLALKVEGLASGLAGRRAAALVIVSMIMTAAGLVVSFFK